MATVKRRSTVPYYAAAGTWVIYALLFPLYRVPQFIFIGIVSAVVYFIMNAVCGTVEVTVPDPPKKEESTGNPELDKMIKDGNLAISEMKRLNTSIKDEKISADIDRLEDLSAKIFAQVKADPKKLPQIRKFMDYYLQQHTLRISLHTPCKILHPPTSNITPMGFRICTSPLQNLNPSPSDFEGDYFRI